MESKTIDKKIEELVHKHYWINNDNCAITIMSILSEYFNISINKQVYDALIGMNGAGTFGAQCGLVEGTLTFIGILGIHKKLSKDKIENLCKEFAIKYEIEKGSILCKELRPLGFFKDNPPHLCEKLTVDSLSLSINFITENIVNS